MTNRPSFTPPTGLGVKMMRPLVGYFFQCLEGGSLDGRNRAIVIAESLARVIAAIRFTIAFVVCHLSLQNTEISPHRPFVCCAAIGVTRLACIRVTSVPQATAEWLERVDRVR